MAENLGKWPSKRGPISKIRPSDGYGRDPVPLTVERWYDFKGFGWHLGNVGLALAGPAGADASRPVVSTARLRDRASGQNTPMVPSSAVAGNHTENCGEDGRRSSERE